MYVFLMTKGGQGQKVDLTPQNVPTIAISNVKKWKRMARARHDIPFKGSNNGTSLTKKKIGQERGKNNSLKKRDKGLHLIDEVETIGDEGFLAKVGS